MKNRTLANSLVEMTHGAVRKLYFAGKNLSWTLRAIQLVFDVEIRSDVAAAAICTIAYATCAPIEIPGLCFHRLLTH